MKPLDVAALTEAIGLWRLERGRALLAAARAGRRPERPPGPVAALGAGAEAIRELVLRPGGEPQGRRRALAALARWHIQAVLGPALEDIEAAEAELPVPLPRTQDKAVPLIKVSGLLAQTRHRQNRRELFDAYLQALAATARRREAFLAQARATVSELGWPHPLAMAEDLHGLDAAALRSLARTFLAASHDAYREAMGWWARRELELPLADMRLADLPFLLRAETPGGAVAVSALQRLGLSARLELLPVAELPGGSAGVHQGPQPGTAILLHHPGSYQAGHPGFIAALGQALPILCFRPSPGRPMWTHYHPAGRGLAQALTLIWSGDPGWRRAHFALGDSDGVTDVIAGLYRVRRLAALALFALDLSGPELPGPAERAERYRGLLLEALGFEPPAQTHLLDTSWDLQALWSFLGYVLGGQLLRHLDHYFGRDHHLDPRAGEFLGRFFEGGPDTGPGEYLARLDLQVPNGGPLLEYFERRL